MLAHKGVDSKKIVEALKNEKWTLNIEKLSVSADTLQKNDGPLHTPSQW